MPSIKPSRLIRLSLAFAACFLSAFAVESKRSFDVPAGPADAALKVFAEQSGRGLLVTSEAAKGVATKAVKGAYTAQEALDRMLADTGLVASQDPKNGAFVVKKETTASPNAPRLAQTDSDQPGQGKVEGGVLKLDTFEVFGSKSINADIRRTRDDAQPYVVFGRTQIDASMATNLEEFLRTRLPMNQTFRSTAQSGAGTQSTVNLRGLGANQTLILVDGRRLPPRAGNGGFTSQADINGIPFSMIERIEILPSTASGIYGGGATGGVINIITKKDYAGVEVSASYLNTFDTDASTRRLELNGSFQLEGGKTLLTFNASRVDFTALVAQDRELLQRGRKFQLTNNPAAFYGVTSPPVGYLTNIRNQSGANLVLKNGTPLNSPITFVPAGYQGPAGDGGAALVANAGQYSLDLPNTVTGGLSRLTTLPEQESYGLSVRRKFGRQLELLVDASRFENQGEGVTAGIISPFTLAANAPNNPFTTAVNVSYPVTNLTRPNYFTSTSDRLLAGVVVRLPADWTAGADYVRSRSKNISIAAISVVGDPDGTGPAISYATALSTGVINAIRDLNLHPLDYSPYLMRDPFSRGAFALTSDEITVRGSGPLRTLPAGQMALSISAQFRKDRIPDAVTSSSFLTPTQTYNWNPAVSLKSRAYYAELQVPVLGQKDQAGLQRSLDLQLSVRRDEAEARTRATTNTITVASPEGPFPAITYTEPEYAATKATVGLKYAPLTGIALRASFGSGFLAPNLNQLGSLNPTTNSNLGAIDPRRGNTLVNYPITFIGGGNPALRPEASKSVSVGLIFAPRVLPGFRLSVDYTRITKTDEITSLSSQQWFDNEARSPGRITRAALTSADQALGYTGGTVLTFDSRTTNVAGKKVEAFDFAADYVWKSSSWGEVQAYAAATYQDQFASKLLPQDPYFNEVGSSEFLKWRGNAGLTWSKGPLGFGWNMQYYDSYTVYSKTSSPVTIASQILNQGSPTIPQEIYHDLLAQYKWGENPPGWQRFFARVQLSVGVQNAFNTRPPVVATTATTVSGYGYLGDPRLASYTINVRRKF